MASFGPVCFNPAKPTALWYFGEGMTAPEAYTKQTACQSRTPPCSEDKSGAIRLAQQGGAGRASKPRPRKTSSKLSSSISCHVEALSAAHKAFRKRSGVIEA